MSATFVSASGILSVQRNEASIINRREIEPLLARARQAVMIYSQAVNCSAMVLDGNGYIIETAEEAGSRTRFCKFCGKRRRDLSGVEESFDSDSGSVLSGEFPCAETHQNALAESRRVSGSYIYTCAAGFVYWTSPVFQRGTPGLWNENLPGDGRVRNGRYAGALSAGRVILGGRKKAAEKIIAFSGDKTAAEKIHKALEEIPEKTHEEIQAMARLLGVCAEGISEKEEDLGKMIRRIIWQERDSSNINKYPKVPVQKTAASPGEAGPEYPMDKERILLAAFRRGDNETGENILKELMEYIIAAVPENFEIIRFRATELVVLLSRAAADTSESDTLLEANNRYIRRIQESKTTEDLVENFYAIAGRMAGKIFSFQGIRHASVLRKAERYIWKNYTKKISLESIAKASGLSAPYFSSVFKEEMGENLSGYLNRLRVERAVALLTETGKSLSEIADLCGFEDQSWFSKIFKKFTGTSPGKYRESSGSSSVFKDKA